MSLLKYLANSFARSAASMAATQWWINCRPANLSVAYTSRSRGWTELLRSHACRSQTRSVVCVFRGPMRPEYNRKVSRGTCRVPRWIDGPAVLSVERWSSRTVCYFPRETNCSHHENQLPQAYSWQHHKSCSVVYNRSGDMCELTVIIIYIMHSLLDIVMKCRWNDIFYRAHTVYIKL
jgi:hypothetical protein